MKKIDVKKPLELSDGTPVTLYNSLRPTVSNEIWVDIPEPHMIAGLGRIFNTDGSRALMFTGNHIRLRNKVEGFTVGQPVYFRDGREGVFIGSLGSKDLVHAAVNLANSWDDVIVIAAWPNGLQHKDSRGMESADDFFGTKPVPAPTFTFRNVYSDGTAGTTAHKALDTAKMAAKVGKTRVGILKIGSDDTTELLKCKPAVRVRGAVGEFTPLA